MSDYMAAQITIGGCLSRAIAQRLCKVITQTGVSLDWDEARFEPAVPEELISARRTIDGEWLLSLMDNEARYGSFVDLEDFLVKHEIPFDRQSDSGHGYDACLVTYRPEAGRIEWLANSQGQPAVPVAPIWDLEEELRVLARANASRFLLQQMLRQALANLADAVPARPTALRTFEIGKTVGLRKAA